MITRQPIPQPYSLLADLGVLTLLTAILYGVVQIAKHWSAPLQEEVAISLSLWALPGYTLLSLLRGVAAYGISLAFTLVYGYVAAHRQAAERVMLPLLDIMQSIPVLGFLPGAVLALVSLFPRTNVGLELASILMIFTGQVCNMTLSFYHSIRSIPSELREASSVYQFNWWQHFRRVELPASAVGLAWNSMMGMAGGWFFLIVCEAFTLGPQTFRLPGLGAYMSVAIAQRNSTAIIAAIIAMVAMIVLVDTLVWRPVLVWTQKFRLEDTAPTGLPASTVLNWFRRSWVVQAGLTRVAHPISEWLAVQRRSSPEQVAFVPAQTRRWPARVLSWAIGALATGGTLWAAWRLVHLIAHLPLDQWMRVLLSALLTLLRVSAAVVLGSLWTVPAGIWIGQSDRRRNLLQPLVQIAASFPAPMLYPLILLAMHALGLRLGVGAVILMTLGTQWYILFNVIAGVSSVPEDIRAVARAYRFTASQRWRRMWWPAVFPYLVTGWIAAAGGAWNASIVAEYVADGPTVTVTQGLGSLISEAASGGHYDLLAASVLTMAALVIFINRHVWKQLSHLAETRYAY